MTEELERDLASVVRGEVAADPGSRALMTMDASNYRRVPLCVVAPYDADDVAAALETARRHGVPVVPRGAGTSIAGNATGLGVVLDFTRHMNRIVSLDPGSRTAVVQPGLVLDRLRDAAAPHGLTFGPDPSTHSRCTLGGMIGNNACGSHSVAWGTTADNVHTLDVVTRSGDRFRAARGLDGLPARLRDGITALTADHLALLRTGFPDLPRRISGYALDALLPEHHTDVARALTGSEGTLAVVTGATVRLVEAPTVRALAVLGYADESGAAEAACTLLPFGPLTVEGMAADLAGRAASTLPRGTAWLFVEVGGADAAEAGAAAARIRRHAESATGATGTAVVTDPAGQRVLWRLREDASGTATRMPDGSEAWPGWEDCAVPPARLGDYLRAFRGLLTEHGLRGQPYGHFGDGCIHVRIDFDLDTAPGTARFRGFSEDLAALVVAHGGSLSGEHGDGLARSELLSTMYGSRMTALFDAFKDLWDPDGALNPGVIARPAPLDADLRFTPLPSRPVDVTFGYPHDGGDFRAAVRRCVGVAKCRTTEPSAGGGVMCPSFRATGDEKHSTRGRARLLHEMLAGDLVTGGWRSPEVRDALDLCLSCKGCRTDCPVGVDMATYKAEFLHHHYAGRLRPAAHYTMGMLPASLRAAAALRLPGVVNALTSLPPLASAAKRLGGLAPERALPSLAPEPFTRWWRRRGGPRGTGRTVVLWPDTFTTYLRPQAGRAAVRVLEDAGLRVVVPPGPVCCGLTYVSTGQLDRARRVMNRTLRIMRTAIDAGTPVVGLEPSCTAALRTDLPELLGTRAADGLAGSVRTFAQALEEYAPDWTPPRLDRPVTGQTHCHQHAVLGDEAEQRLRDAAGLTGTLVGGCCGLAGNFGFEPGHHEVSTACAEEQLLPAVRSAAPGTAVLADGYSCHTQLAQLAGADAVHLAELLAGGLASTAPATGPEPDPA